MPIIDNGSELTGKGVIIGVVDTGIDPNHTAFKGRILRIWDQTINGPGFWRPDLAWNCKVLYWPLSRDFNGHGTHVAGIAAGADSIYGGVASEAELIIIKTTFQDAHIAAGIEYIFRVAQEMNRPAVIN